MARITERCHACGGKLKEYGHFFQCPHYKCSECNREHFLSPTVGELLAFPYTEYDLSLIQLTCEMDRWKKEEENGSRPSADNGHNDNS